MAKLFSANSTNLQQSLPCVNSWMEFYQFHLPQQNVTIYLFFATLMLIMPVINIILEIKRFVVCLQCMIWLLLFLVISKVATLFEALSLKLLFIHTKF